jgi:hypothetical protein
MAARPGSDSRKFPRPRSPINGIWLGVSANSLREALHPTEYEARTFFRWERREVVAGLVLCCHGPGEPESLGVLGRRTKVASVMALGSRSPQGYLKSRLRSMRCRSGPNSSNPISRRAGMHNTSFIGEPLGFQLT